MVNSRTTNEEQLLVAILLAEQRSCDIWQVALTHVEHLFTETDQSVHEEKLFDELNRLHILSLLVLKGRELFERWVWIIKQHRYRAGDPWFDSRAGQLGQCRQRFVIFRAVVV